MTPKTQIVLTALLLSWSPAIAAGDEDKAARDHFDRGVQLLDDSQFAGAAAELERSLTIRETPPVLFNLGLAYRGVGRHREAIEKFERFMQVRDEKRHEKMAQLAQTILTELRAELVHVVLKVEGGATSVRVDGRSFAKGDGTHRLVLDPGEHTYEVQRPGYAPIRRRQHAEPGDRLVISLDASGKPKPASISVETMPVEAEIFLDGKLVGRGRYRGEVAQGTRKLRVIASGYEASARSIRVGAGSQQHVSIILTEQSRPMTGQWWFWAGSAAVVGAAVFAIIVAQPEEQSPHEGSLGFVTEAIR